MSNPNSDTIVFNASVSNNTNAAKRLQFSEFRNQNILDKAEDYYVRVFEAKIPMMSVPFFKMLPNDMSVCINNQIVFLVPIQLNPVNGSTYYIFYIQQFLQSLNAAFTQAHLLNGYTSSPPVMIYDFENELLQLVVDIQYYGDGTLPIPIYFNPKLMYKFTGFMNLYNATAVPGQEYRILYESFASNYLVDGGTQFNINYEAIFMPSQAKFYKDLTEYQSIILTTRALKVNEQYISNQDGNNASLPILAEIPISFDELNSSKYLTFSQVFPKWTCLNTFGNIRALDLNAYFVGDDFEINDVFILAGQKFNVRLEFIHKSLVKNYEIIKK
jgi:hypothetical protein